MQLKVHEAMSRINVIDKIVCAIEEGEPTESWRDDIHDLLLQYSDILEDAKVMI